MRVSVRVKKGHFYLEIYDRGLRRWEALGITESSDPKQSKDSWRMAEVLRSKREHQIVSGEWGLLDPLEGKRPVVDYCRDLATVMGPKTHLPKSLKYLEEYAAGIQIGAINERWLEGYKGHLLAAEALGKTTASHYFAALCFALKRAERDRLIPRNPADAVARIPVLEAMKVYLTEAELQALADHPLGGVLGAEIMRGFFFAVYVGLRVSDVEGLTWGRVERGPKPRVMMLQEKTQVVVGIPLSASAWSLIEDRVIHRHDAGLCEGDGWYEAGGGGSAAGDREDEARVGNPGELLFFFGPDARDKRGCDRRNTDNAARNGLRGARLTPRRAPRRRLSRGASGFSVSGWLSRGFRASGRPGTSRQGGRRPR